MSKITDFKECYKRFFEALDYINKNYDRLKSDPVKFEKVKKNFQTKFEIPMDILWKELTKEEQNKVWHLYVHKQNAVDETVQKVVKAFNGKIIPLKERS